MKIILQLKMRGSCLEEVNAEPNKLDSVIKHYLLMLLKQKLAKAGHQLIQEHSFACDCLDPKCFEVFGYIF